MKTRLVAIYISAFIMMGAKPERETWITKIPDGNFSYPLIPPRISKGVFYAAST